jgi:hypothetical protein
MAGTYKVLGQSSPSATTLTDIYTVPALKQAVISTITVCNRAASISTFRISVAPAGAADANSQYLYYDLSISENNSFAATIGITLNTTDVVRVYSSSTNLSFSLFGTEIS